MVCLDVRQWLQSMHALELYVSAKQIEVGIMVHLVIFFDEVFNSVLFY